MAVENDLRVGIPVSFRFGTARVIGSIKEDRGPIGKGGRRLYLVRFAPEANDESFIELPADELQVEHHSFR